MNQTLELCKGMEIVRFSAGEVMIPEGGKTGCLYFLISGAVEVIKGESPIIVIRQPGAILGEISILTDQPHTATVEALEDTSCYVTRGGRAFLEQNPLIVMVIAEMMAMRLTAMMGYLGDLKAQYEDRKDHLGMVDELLLNLAHRTGKKR